MADRIVILDRGRIAQVGTPAEVYQRPASSFVAAFMGAENEVELRASAEDAQVTLATPDGEYRLPRSARLGDHGVHWEGGDRRGGAFSTRFRSDEAALVQNGTKLDGHLGLPGTVRQASYPGGSYRYAVESCGRLLMINDPETYHEGAEVTISVPASSLHVFPAGDERSA